jgi:hypothetical protein
MSDYIPSKCRMLWKEAVMDWLKKYVVVLISLWLFLFDLKVVCNTIKRIFLGWVKEVRTMKS